MLDSNSYSLLSSLASNVCIVLCCIQKAYLFLSIFDSFINYNHFWGICQNLERNRIKEISQTQIYFIFSAYTSTRRSSRSRTTRLTTSSSLSLITRRSSKTLRSSRSLYKRKAKKEKKRIRPSILVIIRFHIQHVLHIRHTYRLSLRTRLSFGSWSTRITLWSIKQNTLKTYLPPLMQIM